MPRNAQYERSKTPDAVLQKAVSEYLKDRNIAKAGRRCGYSRDTLARHLGRACERGFMAYDDLPQHAKQRANDASRRGIGNFDKLFELEKLPSKDRSIEEILSARRAEYSRRDNYEKARQLIEVRVKAKGPIGIVHFGDPHLDNPGCDIAEIERHIALIKATPGMMAANVGDTTDNWVGRLAALYDSHGTTAKEAWKLAEWMMKSIPWLYVIGGNHDCWSGNRDLLSWMAGQVGTLYEAHGARINLKFLNGKQVRINARHTFPGHSQWNAAHGVSKAAQMGWRDHVLVCGHKHTSGYQLLKDPSSGLISHAIHVAAYKKHDDYAKALGFADNHISSAVCTVIDPSRADSDPGLITAFHEIENAADYLTWLRSR